MATEAEFPDQQPYKLTVAQALARAGELHQQGCLHEAEALYLAVLRAAPGDVDCLRQLGLLCSQQGRFDEAIGLIGEALSANPDLADAHNDLGNALAACRRHTEAIEHYRRALALRPGFTQAHNNLGNALVAVARPDEAIAHFEQALAIDPAFAVANFNLGNALMALDRPAEAIAQLEKVVAATPDFAAAHRKLGLAQLEARHFDEAIASFERALALEPDHVEALCGLGSGWQALDRPEQARDCYARALAIDAKHADAHHGMGNTLQTLGDLAQARQEFETAIVLAPRAPAHYRGLADLKRFSADDPHLRAMEALALDLPSLGDRDRIELEFALGKAYDDTAQHERAFAHLLAGNALQRRAIDYDETLTLAMFGRIAEVFTPELVARAEGLGDPSPAPVFIIGMPRSGTTLIEQLLASHPAVFGGGELRHFADLTMRLEAGGDPPSYFPGVVASMSGAELRSLGERYLARVRLSAPTAERITDKMPANFRFAGLIHMALANARIIHAMRDPVDTCVSCFSKMFGPNLPYTYDLAELGRYYRAYAGLMAHWRRVLPAGVMLEVQYEDLVADFDGEARRIVAHCALAWDDACLGFHKTRRPVRTASAAQVRQPIFTTSIGRHRVYGELLTPLLAALGDVGSPAGVRA